MRPSSASVSVACLTSCALACSSPGEEAHHAETTATTTATETGPTSTATAAPLTSATPVASAPAAGTACLMWQVCGCFDTCVAVPVASADLHDGMRTRVISGREKGRPGFIAKAALAGGGETLVVTDSDPHAPRPCSTKKASPFLGYLCDMAHSGPIPKDACAAGCQ